SYNVGTADFNRDGTIDVADIGNVGVVVQLGAGDGTFGAPIEYPLAAPSSGQDLAVGDFNGDGRIDVAALSGVDVHVLAGGGDGTLLPAALIAHLPVSA